MKWVVDRIGKVQTWYSADVVEKIYRIAKWASGYYNNKNDDVLQCAEKHQRIVDIIESEDK
jgi:hypothetical protein